MSNARRELADVPLPAFFGTRIDRVAALRDDPSWVAQQLRSAAARTVAAGAAGVLVESGDGAMTLARRVLADAAAGSVDAAEPLLLGVEDGAPLFAVDLDALERSAQDRVAVGASVVGLREAGAEMPQSEGGLAAYLWALLDWHRRHRFCANCGASTRTAQAGHSRRCPRCGASHFPRTDPVVIMLVEHAGRLLLGRRPGWPENRYSVLAGFVSPGESLAEAVVREVREESGIEVHDPVYVTSQPWPFPSSLMLGFEAQADGGEPVVGDGELEDVRWFPGAVVLEALTESGPLRLPPPISIARYLIERWVARR
jgi:NAD+ diphosphatase